MKLAIEKAKKYGMGMVAVRNSTHYGIAGYYATMATQAGCIGLTGTNARPSIAPTFGVENMLGTNPLTFGLPTDEDFPFVLDCATSITQRGKIEYFARLGKDTPAGMVIGDDGSVLTDSDSILERLVDGSAALAPLGGVGEELAGYKGYGYATVVEILSSALQAGNYMKLLTGIQDGKKFPSISGTSLSRLIRRPLWVLRRLKRRRETYSGSYGLQKKAPDCERIYTAGEKEYLVWLERKDRGVPVNDSVMKELITIRDELGLDPIRYHFI
jgi:LDH2 family malate/lactate/ureidoglycolate dehydrogenase